MNLTREQLAVAYDCVLFKMQHTKDNTEGYKANLYELEGILAKEIEKQKKLTI